MTNNNFEPIPSSFMFKSLLDMNTIIMTANPRIALVTKGIMRAAKEMDAPLILELARSECNLEGGYAGLTPAAISKITRDAAKELEFDMWSLHADHIGIKKGTDEDIEATKKLVDGQIEAGYTSFAIDASHLFNFQGGNLREELANNIDATTKIGLHIKRGMGDKEYGLEVEVGEIGREDEHGRVLTRPEEAVTFIKALNENGVYPHFLAIANGSAHGNTYDTNGNRIEQVSVDIEQTVAVAQALKDNNLDVRIAQHGITGTPRDLIHNHFPHGDIVKGNVATFYQNIVWDLFKVYEPELYKDLWDWTIANYKEKAPEKNDNELFGKFSKFAIKEFFDRIYSVGEDTLEAIDAMCYAETLIFIKAFNGQGTAKIVRDHMA
ncbi:class II fructose-bisphosphate aldolase [Methanococcoides burtonii]|uniref:Class II fructose-bisphosphate aldolase family protein n=1 Tax=Methanococcoides burtonii (strain DSM 6242 / NBRC 107633 / OCM 468 / ACE-M) TaxID=259564 RepID=Q12UM7_METBU|nr:class II fructose-bisphosphate aldolase [Methanococcoides burtonii]ABE52849.1 class II fructose-bisphosphate aldolase family protein [Methanococcoides burtonii DSM 6242]